MSDPTSDALHAERLARLTTMAQRVWPNARAVADGKGALLLDKDGERWTARIAFENQPNALDALEAALLVLAGESCADDVVRALAAKLYAERDDTLDRVMQLADEWEASVADEEHQHYEGGCPRCAAEHYAAELRERARKP